MEDHEFQSQINALPPGIRFVVGHVVQLSIGVIVLFGGLLIAALATHEKERSYIAAFCAIAIVLACLNMLVFTRARKRLMGSHQRPEGS
jgi:Na+/melibiose symporter-like transporter